MDPSDAWRYALTAFLVLTGVGLTFVLVRLGIMLGHATTSLDEATAEIVPMLSKTSVTLDHVNDELAKVGKMTDTAVDTVETVDRTARTVSHAATAPVRAATSAAEGLKHAYESFRSKRGQRGSVL